MNKCFLGLGLLAIAWSSGASAADRIVLPTDVVPTHYEIAFSPDAANLKFTGMVTIDLDIQEATREITLNAADLSLSRISLSGESAAPQIVLDEKNETATFRFPAPLAPGRRKLTIDYTGKINTSAAGLFALDYDTGATKKRALFTQFEAADARRFVPCWDEPNRKATFALTATIGAADFPVSNMPIASSEKVAGGLKRVHFATSPKMSSYLLFFSSGDMERLARKVNGVEIGIVFKRGDAAKAAYSLDAAAHLLPFYEDYFGVKYPLPKLDLIAGPGSSQFFGAMENWGAIFYFETALLIDAKTSTEAEKRSVYSVVAHEMAHQWFGDLVTMDWWDDLWLNEGYATWMAFKAAGHFHPEWMVTLGQVSSKDVSMARDSRVGTHAIVQPILDVLQASQAFDGITYRKGAAVINMLEDYVGADVFRDGVRAYIAGHAYGNTVTDDLWREVDKISPRKITEIAHDFTLQDGVPLIVATPSGNDVRLTQKRFALDESGKAAHSWRVPVIARVPGTAAPWRGIVAAQTPVTIPGASAAGVLLNVGQNGYYRAQYAPALFAKLAAGFKKLPPADQLGTLYDTRMLGYSGDAPLSNLLGLAEQSEPGMDRHVLATVADRLSAIDSFYRDLPSQGTLRAFGRKVLQPVLAQTGWDPKPGESENEPLLRATLLATLSEFDDPGVIGEARRLFAEYLQHPNGHSADKRRAMLEIVALHADNATWNQLHNLAKSTSDSIQKERYYGLLGHALDPELAARALALTLSDEVAVTTRPNIIGAVSVNNPDLAFDFAIAHLDTVMSWIEPSSATTFMPGIASNSLDPKIIPKLEAYAAAHIPASARRSVTVAEGAIRFNIMVREKRLPEVDRWLARHGF